MPRARFQRLDTAEQRRILHGAAAEFSENGFARSSLNRILRATKLSKGAMYYYFDDKADLFAAVVDHALSHYRTHAPSFDFEVDAEGYWPQVESVMRTNLKFGEDHPWVIGLARTLLRRLETSGPGQMVNELVHSALLRYLRRGQELGLVRTDVPESLLVASAAGLGTGMDRWALGEWEKEHENYHALVPTLVDCFRRLVEPRDAFVSATASTERDDP